MFEYLGLWGTLFYPRTVEKTLKSKKLTRKERIFLSKYRREHHRQHPFSRLTSLCAWSPTGVLTWASTSLGALCPTHTHDAVLQSGQLTDRIGIDFKYVMGNFLIVSLALYLHV